MTNKEAIRRILDHKRVHSLNEPRAVLINEALDLAIQALGERPQGEWYYNCQNGWHCSLCHKTVKFMPTIMGKANFDFCPNCGADMRNGGAE